VDRQLMYLGIENVITSQCNVILTNLIAHWKYISKGYNIQQLIASHAFIFIKIFFLLVSSPRAIPMGQKLVNCEKSSMTKSNAWINISIM